MKIISTLDEILKLEEKAPNIGLTIGNFDGVHLGHRDLLLKIKKDCVQKNLKFVLVTFIPHPQKILQPEKEKFLINSYVERRSLLNSVGVDYLVELKFTRDFSTLSAEDFLEKYLICYSNLKYFYLGYDFAFGANKLGTFDLVKKLCSPRNIEVIIQSKFERNGRVISSSLIRELLLSGNIESVDEILARPFFLEGLVVKGEGRGKKIGFPTANIQVDNDLIVPAIGVYITQTKYNGMVYNSVTNIGHNPTFKDSKQVHVETNLFDFNTEIYGENIHINFVKKIRNEKKFATVNDLVEQIKSDVLFAKEFFLNNRS